LFQEAGLTLSMPWKDKKSCSKLKSSDLKP
jgi:hypothetical protein